MAKEVKTIVADNGKEFDSLEEAARYDEFLAAKERFETACNQWNQALATQFTTGDGKPFSFEQSDYYYVRQRAHGSIISREYLYSRECTVTDEGKVIRSKYTTNGPSIIEFEIEQLFTREKPALIKLLEFREQEHQWAADDIAQLKAQIEKAY